MDRKYIWTASIAGAVVVLDQITKYLVLKYLAIHESITVIPGFFNLIHVRNPGAAFGMLSGLPPSVRIVFFVAVTIAAVIVLGVLIRKTEAAARLPLVAYSLIAGGAVGNAIDRLRFGEVVDFVDWYVRSFHWHTFNVADSAITVGVGLLIIDILRKPRASTEG